MVESARLNLVNESELPHTQLNTLGCLNPHPPTQNHRMAARRWCSQGLSTFKNFLFFPLLSNNLPNASFKDVHVY